MAVLGDIERALHFSQFLMNCSLKLILKAFYLYILFVVEFEVKFCFTGCLIKSSFH